MVLGFPLLYLGFENVCWALNDEIDFNDRMIQWQVLIREY
jgi:hypothetical protein